MCTYTHTEQKTCISHENSNWKLFKCPLTEERMDHCDTFIDRVSLKQTMATQITDDSVSVNAV